MWPESNRRKTNQKKRKMNKNQNQRRPTPMQMQTNIVMASGPHDFFCLTSPFAICHYAICGRFLQHNPQLWSARKLWKQFEANWVHKSPCHHRPFLGMDRLDGLSNKACSLFVSGPAFWGLINPEWSLCNKGRRQSPVNLEPQRLLFDPNLRPMHIDKHRVSPKCPLGNENEHLRLYYICFSRIICIPLHCIVLI